MIKNLPHPAIHEIFAIKKAVHKNGELLLQLGGAKRDRTADLYNAIVALSQLSYDPNVDSFVKEKTFPMQQKNQ